MKNGNDHSNPASVDKLATEVSHILFGDDSASEMQLRLTRIALEHYEVPQIMNRPNGEAFKGIVPEIGRIIFGDEKLSEMHLRLTRIALERYGVHQMAGAPVVTNGVAGTNGNGHTDLRRNSATVLGAC